MDDNGLKAWKHRESNQLEESANSQPEEDTKSFS